jgi:hypothetical protein
VQHLALGRFPDQFVLRRLDQLRMSMLTVAGLVLSLQLLVAICSSMPLSNAFPRLREEITSL